MTADPAYLRSLEAWRADRIARLTAEDGWLNLIGRWEIGPGTATVGAAAGNDIVIGAGPDRLGEITLEPDGNVAFSPAAGGETIRIVPNRKAPPRFDVGRFLFEIMSIGEGLALRGRDREHPDRTTPPVIDYFDVDESWRVGAEWVPLEQPVEAEIETMIGTVNKVPVTHKAVFEHDGVRCELLPSYGTPRSPQFVIRDRTAATETYQASRFVYGEGIEGGTIVIDFNKAINPPCAFTDFAVCPLPPAQNILPFRIEAGELRLRR